MITIVLADDHHIVREGIKSLLETESDFQIIGEASDGIETTQLVEQLEPDILVLDLMMRGLDGLEVAKIVGKHSPGTKVIILSMYSNEAYVMEALRAGVKGYILKESTSDELVSAIRTIANGHRFLSSSLSEQAIEAYIQIAEHTAVDPYDTLTTREREVLHLVSEGYTNNDISTRLYISRRTVEAHRHNMMKKLGLQTQTDIIRYAIRRGILPPDK